MAQRLGNVAVGTVLKLKENGSPKDYIVVNQGLPSYIYDSSCDGTWILRKDIIEKRVWAANGVEKFETSDILAWLNDTMIKMYDADIQAVIKEVKIPYRKNGATGSDQSGENGLPCKSFLLSALEIGLIKDSQLPRDGSKLAYFESGDGTTAEKKTHCQF